MHRLLTAGAIPLIFLLSADAPACQTDRDCGGAGRCVKTWGQIDGVCERGLPPIQGDDPRPVGHPDRPRSAEGQACELTVDCVQGLVCAMQPNTSARICSR
jgi:hypothetical protein